MAGPPAGPTRGTALITGASAGIGAELANVFASRGHDVVLVARSKDRLERIADELADRHGVAASAVVCDLSRAGAADDLHSEVRDRSVAVDCVVNNAGFGIYGPFAETDTDAEIEMMQLNMVTLTHVTKVFLPEMLQRNRGRILNVASTAAFLPGPLMAVYYATKAYVLSFSEALAEELRGTGVTVTVLCPGPTRSDFQETAGLKDSRLLRAGLMDAPTVARAGYDGMMKGRAVVVPGVMNKLTAQAPRLSPRRATVRVVRFVQDRVG